MPDEQHNAVWRGVLRAALAPVLVCAGYYVAGIVSLISRFPSSGIATVWLASAVLLVALLITPGRMWWLYVVALVPAHWAVAKLQGDVPLVVMLCQFAGNVTFAVIAALALKRLIAPSPRLEDLRSMAVFILVAGLVVSWGVSAGVVSIFKELGWVQDFWVAWRGRSLGNGIGALLVVPPLLWALSDGVRSARHASPWRYAELGSLLAGLFVVTSLGFGQEAGGPGSHPALLYAPLPLLLWAAVRFGPSGLCLTLLLMAVVSLSHAMGGRGPFAAQSPIESVMQLQLLLLATGTPLLLLAALVQERRSATAALARSMSAVQHEIAERERAERRLRDSEEQYRSILENQTELVCRYLADTRLTFVNDAYCRHFGKRPDELLGRSFLELIPEGGRKAAEEQVRALTMTRQASTTEREAILPNGRTMWLQWVDYPVPRGEGPVVEIQSIGRDVTERRVAEEALRRAMSEMERLKEELQAENIYLREELVGAKGFEQIIGSSEALRKVLHQAEQAARTDSAILLLGETGTGKELLARAIHSLSPRNNGPFVAVNCAALPADLVESELFGHERGAFTGAVARQVGKFELANKGTILLDEVGELPLQVQAKLLRTLQEGEIQRLGGTKPLKVDVRIVAATNRDLAEEVRQKRFRSDLYYRLNVLPVTLPPLRERREDIPLLVNTFVTRVGRRIGKEISAVPQSVIEALQNYHWPGNIRELQNVIERTVVLTPGKSLRLLEPLDSTAIGAAPRHDGNQNALPTDDVPLAELERQYILRVLNKTHWRIDGPHGAAVILGLNSNTLRGRMRKLGIMNERRGRSRVHDHIDHA